MGSLCYTPHISFGWEVSPTHPIQVLMGSDLTSRSPTLVFCFCFISILVFVESLLCPKLLVLVGGLSYIYFQIIFTEKKMKQKRTDRESAKAVKEQVFMSRYKSEPCLVESSVSKSSACNHYCCSDFSVARGSKNNIHSTASGLCLKTENTENTQTFLKIWI